MFIKHDDYVRFCEELELPVEDRAPLSLVLRSYRPLCRLSWDCVGRYVAADTVAWVRVVTGTGGSLWQRLISREMLTDLLVQQHRLLNHSSAATAKALHRMFYGLSKRAICAIIQENCRECAGSGSAREVEHSVLAAESIEQIAQVGHVAESIEQIAQVGHVAESSAHIAEPIAHVAVEAESSGDPQGETLETGQTVIPSSDVPSPDVSLSDGPSPDVSLSDVPSLVIPSPVIPSSDVPHEKDIDTQVVVQRRVKHVSFREDLVEELTSADVQPNLVESSLVESSLVESSLIQPTPLPIQSSPMQVHPSALLSHVLDPVKTLLHGVWRFHAMKLDEFAHDGRPWTVLVLSHEGSGFTVLGNGGYGAMAFDTLLSFFTGKVHTNEYTLTH